MSGQAKIRIEHAATSGAARPLAYDDDKYEIDDAVFAKLAQIIRQATGIVLTNRKRHLLTSRLRKRLLKLNLPSYKSYIDFLSKAEGAAETTELINAISTNLTGFFREPHHFRDMIDCLQHTRDRGESSSPLRIWSAACSTGQEPYSAAMALVRSNILRSIADVRILATDIDTAVLQKAKAGIYTAKQMDGCALATQRNCFARRSGDSFELNREVKSLIVFNQLNLQQRWPISCNFDFIYCRNVLIYFDNTSKSEIIARLVEVLKPGGTLYLGHSESLLGNTPGLSGFGNCIFRKSP